MSNTSREKIKERANMITTLCSVLDYTPREMAEAFDYVLSNFDEFITNKELLDE